MAEQVARGLGAAKNSALLELAEQARAASAWLASVELEALSRLLGQQTHEAREEIEGLARVEPGVPRPVAEGQSTGRSGAEAEGWAWTVAEVACAFRLTSRQAEGRVNLAATLRALPQVHGLLRAGKVDEYRARVIAETLSASALSPREPAWDEVVDLVCRRAPDRTHSQIRQHLNRALLKVDPDAVTRRRQKALGGREVRWWAEADGMATLQAKLSGESAAVIDTALSAMADAARDHGRRSGGLVAATHQERRADALGEVFRAILEGRALPLVPASSDHAAEQAADRAGAAADDAGPARLRVPAWWQPPPLPTRKGRRPHLIVTISEKTLDGQDDAPAELDGYGPIPADMGRRIAGQAGTRTTVTLPTSTWKRPEPVPAGSTGSAGRSAPTKPTGPPAPDDPRGPDGAEGCAESGCGSDKYAAGRALIDAVTATYPTCQAPGCTRAAAHCDVDHVIPYRAGGRTCRHNLRPLCRGHHRLKTHARWRRTAGRDTDPPGTVIWTTRLGRRYTVPPPDRPGSPDW